MIQPKTSYEIEKLRQGGRKLAMILDALARKAAPETPVASLDEYARELCDDHGITPAFLHYQPNKSIRPFPGAVCVSINDTIVHGVPNETARVLKEGDIVSLDMGVVSDGLVTDAAVSIGVGQISDTAQHLLQITEEALEVGIQSAWPGVYTGDVGNAIETFVRQHGYSISRGLAGHGVGYDVHEEPLVPNTGTPGHGDQLVPGMVIAIEPMLTLGTSEIVTDDDGWSIRTADGSLAAHFEHTVAITEDGPEVLTVVAG